MRRRLVHSRGLFEVPEDLTYWVHDQDYLVVNPEAGSRCLLTRREFQILQALARRSPIEEPLVDDEDTERTLAKLILSWVVYFNGNRPRIPMREPTLSMAYYAITDGCNLRCPYCYASSEKCLPGELNTAESMDLVSQIAELGTTTLVFTGGEPMLRKDLFQIVEHARRCGLRTNIITNATMIRNAELANRFAELFNNVIISLDGGTAETHDRTRGKGSFAKTYRALQLLNEAGVVPYINHIVTSDNVEELEDFAEFLQGLQIHSVRLMNHDLLGRGATDGLDFGWQDHLRVQQIVWTSPVAGQLQADGPRPLSPCSVKGNCGMGGNEIYVNSLGDVYPCKLITRPTEHAGNIRKQRLAEIFAGPLLGGMRRSTVFEGEYHDDCKKCYVRSSCGGGCRATHMARTGDLRRNSRSLCRILRHGVTTQLWLEAGLTRAEVAAKDLEMTVPRLVADDEIHPVYNDWQTELPVPVAAARAGELIPLTSVARRSTDVAAHQ